MADMQEPTTKPKVKRGFAKMDPDLVRKYARKGGKKVQSLGKGHKFTSEEARQAGLLGVAARRRMAEAK